MKEVTVQSLGLDRNSNTPVVILQEHDGPRVLPIWIGPGEASAIAMELAGMNFSRPLTHDLLASAITGLGGSLQRVVITKVVDNTYYAEMIITREGEFFSLDARPSDSIAIALRMDAGIFTSEELLEHTSIEISEPEEMEEGLTLGEEPEQGEMEDVEPPEDLKEYLRRLHPEDFGRFTP
ncbi:MAG: bifunctional nuclease family protein [Longimicrobiales bacterium]